LFANDEEDKEEKKEVKISGKRTKKARFKRRPVGPVAKRGVNKSHVLMF